MGDYILACGNQKLVDADTAHIYGRDDIVRRNLTAATILLAAVWQRHTDVERHDALIFAGHLDLGNALRGVARRLRLLEDTRTELLSRSMDGRAPVEDVFFVATGEPPLVGGVTQFLLDDLDAEATAVRARLRELTARATPIFETAVVSVDAA